MKNYCTLYFLALTTSCYVSCSSPQANSTNTNEALSISNAGLSTSKSPGENFDLTDWYLSVPIGNNATSIYQIALSDGYELPNYFYTSETDGAMVFKNYIDGSKTSSDADYTRCELREMVYGTRYGNESDLSASDSANNWVLNSSDSSTQSKAGAVDGTLTATVAVNHVTTSGDDSEVGRVIIGQIHANDDNYTLCRLYYRKLPNNSKGSIYFAHQPANSSDVQWTEIIGSKDNSLTDPEDGIALDEVFSYKIEAAGNSLKVTITKDGDDFKKTVDITDSDYANIFMYFKAGIYNQNDSGEDDDYDQVSFYKLDVSH